METSSSHPDDHVGTDFPDIVEIPLPGVSDVNSTDTEIQVIDINNISDSTTTKNKEQKPGREQDGKPTGGNNKENESSRKPDSQGNNQNERPSPGNNESSSNKPNNSGEKDQWDSFKPGNNKPNNSSIWRPSLGTNTDIPDENNWNPNAIGESINQPGEHGWRPIVNSNTTNNNVNKRPNSQNSWSTQNASGSSGNKNILWRPTNPEVKDPDSNPEQGLWTPNDDNMNWTYPNAERPQEGAGVNNWQPQNPNNVQTTWKPQTSENGFEGGNNLGRPETSHSTNPQEENNWRPANVETDDDNEGNGWKPPNREKNQNSEENYWDPSAGNGYISNTHQQSWKPPNTGTNYQNGNTWSPNNGDTYNQHECNEWMPNGYGNQRPDTDAEQWEPVDNGEYQNFRNCNQNKWVPQEDYPENTKGENKNPVESAEGGSENDTNGNFGSDESVNQNAQNNKSHVQDNKNHEDSTEVYLKQQNQRNVQGLNGTIALNFKEGGGKDNIMNNQRFQFSTDNNTNHQRNMTNNAYLKSETSTYHENNFRDVPPIVKHAFNENLDLGEEFRVVEESKKSYSTSKVPTNTEAELKLGESRFNKTTDHGSNANQTREEEKVPLVIVKVRDSTTRKCRAISHDPN